MLRRKRKSKREMRRRQSCRGREGAEHSLWGVFRSRSTAPKGTLYSLVRTYVRSHILIDWRSNQSPSIFMLCFYFLLPPTLSFLSYSFLFVLFSFSWLLTRSYFLPSLLLPIPSSPHLLRTHTTYLHHIHTLRTYTTHRVNAGMLRVRESHLPTPHAVCHNRYQQTRTVQTAQVRHNTYLHTLQSV